MSHNYKNSDRNELINLISPYLFLFLSIQFFLRFYFFYISQIEGIDAYEYIKSFSYGFLYDLITFSWIATILFIFDFIWKKNDSGIFSKYWSSLIWFLFVFIILLTTISEIIFWSEFQSRFNFIAVDYLIYTNEVVKNILESYAFFEVITAIGIISFFSAIVFLKKRTISNISNTITITLSLIIFNIASYYLFHNEMINTDNRYSREISKNGLYSLFSAYIANDLNYEEFYITLDKEKRIDILKSKLGNNFLDNKKRDEILKPMFGTNVTDDSISSIFINTENTKPNLIIITVESLSADFLKFFGNQNNLTPNIDKIINESVIFSNIYAVGTRTVYGLAAISLSMPPIPGNSIVRRPDNEDMFSLGSVLQSNNYHNQFLYGGFGYFDNMNYFFGHNGYEVIDRSDLSNNEITFSNAWGVCDEDIFKRSLKEADKLYNKSQLFSQVIMTTSNHRPFTFPEGKIDLKEYNRESAVKYTDYAIGEFIKEAHKKPWFKNTIFVIVADHTANSCGKIALQPAKHHIPMLIYAPNILKPKVINSLASQIDLAPTLLSIMKLKHENKFYGYDLINTNPNRAFISNYREIGYIEGINMVIMSPTRQKKFFSKNNKDFNIIQQENSLLLETAIAYFQTASEWRIRSKNVNNDKCIEK